MRSNGPLLFVVGTDHGDSRPYLDIMTKTDDPRKADIYLFTGGADIDPMLYGQGPGQFTNWHPQRDRFESAYFNIARDSKKKMLGICRGAQLITAKYGGSLVQHVNGHHGTHLIQTKEGQHVPVASVHHQMMNPFELSPDSYSLLAWSNGLSDVYLDGEDKDIPLFHKTRLEPEVVWYPEIKGLCIQSHPEFMSSGSPGFNYFHSVVEEFLC